MKAAVLTGYNKNGRMLEIRDVPMPEMKDNDVLVKILTAGVNPLDNMIRVEISDTLSSLRILRRFDGVSPFSHPT